MSDKEKTVIETVMNYKDMEKTVPNSSMLREVRWQYDDMASGGDGGDTGTGTSIRKEYYPNKSDRFFQDVRDLMGWI